MMKRFYKHSTLPREDNHNCTDSATARENNRHRLRNFAFLRGLDGCCEALVDERQHTSAGDRSAHEGVELFVAADGELQMTGGYALDAEILRRVAYTAMSESSRSRH